MPRLATRRPAVTDAAPTDGIPVSIIIPARNEAATIETVVASLLASDYGNFELLVVDDRSTDDTADRVRALASHDRRLRLVAGEPLPDGWFGKPWACHQGARAAVGELLLFTDADTTHQPALLGHAVGAIVAEQADLLTLTSRQECRTFWERLVMPQIWLLLGLRYSPASINHATRVDQLVANGQYIMVRRDAYLASGGHQAVAGEVVEDLALAQRFFRQGRRVRMLHGEALLATRMYRNLGELVEGWSKNLYVGARQSAGDAPWLQALAPLALAAGFAYWLVPPVLLGLGIAVPAMLVAVTLSLAFWALISWGMAIPPGYALGYPLGAGMALAIALRSIARGARRIEWRGRTYGASRRHG